MLPKRLHARAWDHPTVEPVTIERLSRWRLNALVVDIAVVGPTLYYLERICAGSGARLVVCTGPFVGRPAPSAAAARVDAWITKPCHPRS